jgi:hypothetical protein
MAHRQFARRTATRTLRLAAATAAVLAGFTTLGIVTTTTPPASADTTVTALNETFNEASFPPANWQSMFGTWSSDCTVTAPMTGCAAVVTVTDGTAGLNELLYNPPAGIPANLQNITLSFYSDFIPDATSTADSVQVMQASVPGDTGDFNNLVTVEPAFATGGDATGVPVLHTVSLPNTNVPIAFRWTSYGDASPTSSETWAISNVTITGTVPATAYSLSADAIPNTANPHVVAGQPVTLHLSGSSSPSGDSLQFNVAGQPNLGTLGPIAQVDATHATVVYTPHALACPDPTGVPDLICPDQFTYTASDAEGNVSAPAKVDLDIQPGGAAGQTPLITAPGSSPYVTLSHQGALTQAADLSSAVSVGPAGFPDPMELDIQASSGTIELLNAAASGATLLNGTASGDQQIDLQGSAAQLNTALGEFLYFPPDGTTPTATINLFASDLGATGNGPRTSQTEATVTVNGIVTNPPPSLALPTGSLAIATNAGPLRFPAGLATGFSVTDTAAGATTKDEVLLSVSGGTLALPAADTSGPTALVTAQTSGGGSTLDLTGSVLDLNLALADLTFDPANLPSETVTLSASAIDPDTDLASTQGSVKIAVTEAPSAFGLTSFTTLENKAAVVFLCGAGPSGDALTFQITANPQHATFAVDGAASAATSGCFPTANAVAYLYTPTPGYIGPDSFAYTVTDPTTGLASSLNTVTITVGAHQKPTAYPVSASTTEDHAVTLTLCGNNPDPDPNPTLTFAIVSPPQDGTLTPTGTTPPFNPCDHGNVPATYTYTPNPGTFTHDGTDSFAYTVSNGTVSDSAQGTITVTTLTPQVFAESASVDENGSLELNLCATDPGGTLTFSFTSVFDGTLDQGAATTSGPPCPGDSLPYGHERYTPNFLFSGSEAFAYQASDSAYTSSWALISITVNKIEIPPTATAQSVNDIAPHPVAITLSGSSLQGSSLTYRVVGNPQEGTLSGTAPNLVYTPDVAAGTDSFTFVANDGTADSPRATVSITIATPDITSSVCVPGASITLDQFACASSLASVDNGQGGAVQLAHTDGVPGAELQLQVTITNRTAVPDTVTLEAPAGTDPWDFRYDLAGQDVTSAITTTGTTVTLSPDFSAGASAYLQVITFDPRNVAGPAAATITMTATSGNDASVSTALPVEIADGTSNPTLSLSQSDGSGTVAFPGSLSVTPPLYAGGPAGSALINAGINGTGDNTFRIQASTNVGSTPGITPQYFLLSTNVTSAVEAGTEVIQCYAGFGCPPMHVELNPASSGSGYWSATVTSTSTIDGLSTTGFVNAQLTQDVGPDLSTDLPDLGIGVLEPTPLTQVVSIPTELSGSSTKRVFLQNQSEVSDTFKVTATPTLASGDTSRITVTASSPGPFGDPGATTDVTSALDNGTYTVTIPPTMYVELAVTDTAGATSASAPPDVVLTATSQLDPAKVDSFGLIFPTYSYRPDAILTGANGQPIGAGVYQQTYPGPVGNSQQDEYDVDQSPTHVAVTLTDRGTGAAPSQDAVVVTAPVTDSNFTITYSLSYLGSTTDVTSALEGPGLSLHIGPSPAPQPVITMTAVASPTAQAGHPGYFPLTVTSQSTLPAALADVVVIGLYNTGESQLRFAGLPQPEPADIATMVSQDGATHRVAPFPSAGYAAGATYGAYSDSSGQKFAYVSAYDTFDLQVASEKTTHTAYRIQAVDPGSQLTGLPLWEHYVFASPYYDGSRLEVPADSFAAGSNLHLTITAGGQDVTAAVEAGTYTTASLGTNETTDLTISFDPPPGDSQRYIPIKFNLINATTGAIEDVMVIDPSSMITCSSNGDVQQQAVISGPDGHERLNFEAFNRLNPSDPQDCLQQLSHSWITTAPVVFSSYVPATDNSPAGGDSPTGLWLVPQNGSILRIDTDTLSVTSPSVKAFVDSPVLGADGAPDPTAAAEGTSNYYFLGNFPDLTWNTTDGTNGLEITSTTLPNAPFPLVTPSTSDWPNNTMAAQRYMQVDNVTGAPLMVGEMDVDVPWYSGDVPLLMDVDSTTGLTLDYAVPQNTSVPLPGDSSVSFYNFYWTTTNDGTVVQGGCLGVPSELFTYLGLGSGPNICILGATVTFKPISPTPGVEAKVAQITVQLINPGLGVKGSPEFNLSGLTGEIDLDPATQDVTKVVIDPDFGIGPPTPCQETQNAGEVKGLLANIAYLPCPTNYFFFNAKITYQQGGFDNSNSGFGLQISGTLTFLNVITLANVEADISTSPFNFHFADSPIDLTISPSIPLSATLTFSGDIGASGFDIGVSGAINVDGYSIASASGVLSTKGFGVCGGILGLSMGFGDSWGSSPEVYGSGCTTSQYQMGT